MVLTRALTATLLFVAIATPAAAEDEPQSSWELKDKLREASCFTSLSPLWNTRVCNKERAAQKQEFERRKVQSHVQYMRKYDPFGSMFGIPTHATFTTLSLGEKYLSCSSLFFVMSSLALNDIEAYGNIGPQAELMHDFGSLYFHATTGPITNGELLEKKDVYLRQLEAAQRAGNLAPAKSGFKICECWIEGIGQVMRSDVGPRFQEAATAKDKQKLLGFLTHDFGDPTSNDVAECVKGISEADRRGIDEAVAVGFKNWEELEFTTPAKDRAKREKEMREMTQELERRNSAPH